MRQTRQFVLLFILFLFSLLTLETNLVIAQEPTPSATWQPLFPSPTARPTINDNCPDGQPIGWLTVTPSSKWLMNCSQCIVQSTADWSDFDVTPFPEEYVSHLGYCTVEEEQEGCYNEQVSGGIGCICLGYPTATPGVGSVTVTPQPTQTAHYYIANVYEYMGSVQGTISNFHEMCSSGDVPYGEYVTLSKVAGADMVAYWQNGSTSGEWGQIRAWDSNPISFWYGLSAGANVDQDTGLNTEYVRNIYENPILTSGFLYTAEGSRTAHIIKKLVCYGSENNEPTPTITPTANFDYCGEVEERPEYIADEIGLDLPIPRFGEGQCIVVGGWAIGLGWLESIFPNLFQFNVPESLGVPGFNLCLHPFTFGYMNLFGILLDMDVMFLLVSYIMVVRWLLRS